jgi:hypothetical protein
MDPTVEAAMKELEQWLRQEVAPVMASGRNWKVILNGCGAADVGYVVETHGKVVKRKSQPDTNKVTGL